MGGNKRYNGYRSFEYLEAGRDYQSFDLVEPLTRVKPYVVPLSEDDEARARRLTEACVAVSLHEHLDLKTADITQMPDYTREGRMATAFEALAESCWDAILDNLMDGHCNIESKNGWKWTEVLHDLGMRLCDMVHQDFLVPGLGTDDIRRAHREGKIAWIASLEGAAMIENELDRIEILYGFGVRCLGITYSESNALGSGLRESRDGGLTYFGRQAVERMNKVGMLIDCSHAGDQTSLDTIRVSEKPIALTHIGARGLWDSRRMAPDEVLRACADAGGVVGVEAAPHTTLTSKNPRHSLESVMEHFEYMVDLVGIDHVSFGPDTIYGDHVGAHGVYAGHLSLEEVTGRGGRPGGFERVDHVRGIENPTEGSHNILRWLVKHRYSDEDIAKVLGENTLRLLEEVWE